MKALLLAAGLGTRLRPLTHHVTKCLVPVAGRPLLDYWVERLIEADIQEVLINTHHLVHQVRDYLKQVNATGQLRLVETYEPQLLGSAGTIAANPAFADDTDAVVVIYADNFSDVSLQQLLTFHRQHQDPVTMLLFHAPNPRACGIAQLDAHNRIVSFTEKPATPLGDLANAGVYVFNREIYQQVAAMQAFDLGFEVLPKLVGKMRGWVWEGYYRDLGTYETYLQAQRDAVELMQQTGRLQGHRPAVFLDRDGTLIEQVHYLSKPEQVKLVTGAASAIQQLRQAGFVCVVVTNQSPLGQGLLTEAALAQIHQTLIEQLAPTQVDGFYYAPEASQVKDRTVVEHYNRKPGPGLLFKAAHDLHLDLTRSWIIGDMISDILAGYHAHCQGLILVETGKGLEGENPPFKHFYQTANLPTAVELILSKRTEVPSW